jgi:hypothetical protein
VYFSLGFVKYLTNVAPVGIVAGSISLTPCNIFSVAYVTATDEIPMAKTMVVTNKDRHLLTVFIVALAASMGSSSQVDRKEQRNRQCKNNRQASRHVSTPQVPVANVPVPNPSIMCNLGPGRIDYELWLLASYIFLEKKAKIEFEGAHSPLGKPFICESDRSWVVRELMTRTRAASCPHAHRRCYFACGFSHTVWLVT